MLRSESWLPQAQALRLYESKRVAHDCGPGLTLKIERQDDGLKAWCFRCNDKGWMPPPAEPLETRLARLREQQEQSVKLMALQPTELPSPAVPWSEWPAEHRLWFLKAGLSGADAGRLGAYYHPPSDRVVLPVLDPLAGIPVFWQARSQRKDTAKYMAPVQSAARVLPRWGTGTAITLTEDILSAYKVGSVEGCEGWSMMGTSIKDHVLAAILKDGRDVNVWLDPDAAGRSAAAKAMKLLRSNGVRAQNIVSTKDPKLIHRGKIKELLA